MTCIVGYVENGVVYMGGDSAGVRGYDVTLRKDVKVFKVGEFIFGFTWSFRMGQILKYSFKPPLHENGVSDEKYMMTVFVDEVRKLFKEKGFARKESDEEKGGEFMVGYRGNIYTIESDYQVSISRENFEAVGCGEYYAKGAMNILDKAKLPPKTKIKLALETAEKFSGGVRSPFVIESL